MGGGSAVGVGLGGRPAYQRRCARARTTQLEMMRSTLLSLMPAAARSSMRPSTKRRLGCRGKGGVGCRRAGRAQRGGGTLKKRGVALGVGVETQELMRLMVQPRRVRVTRTCL